MFIQVYLAHHRINNGHEGEARTCSYKFDVPGYEAYAGKYNKVADLLKQCEECGLRFQSRWAPFQMSFSEENVVVHVKNA
jgi:hypothetical protein